MPVWETIRTQRAVRAFDARPIAQEDLRRIVDAGRRAPSSMNEQRWSFVVCTDRDHLAELAAVGAYADHVAGAAAAVALVTPETDDPSRRGSIAFDLGQCAQNMMLAAWEAGIGSVHAAVYDEPLARHLLGYPHGWRCDYLLSFGYPADPPDGEGERLPLERLLHHERW